MTPNTSTLADWPCYLFVFGIAGAGIALGAYHHRELWWVWLLCSSFWGAMAMLCWPAVWEGEE